MMKLSRTTYLIVGIQLLLICILFSARMRDDTEFSSGKGKRSDRLPGPPMGWNSWNKFHCDGLDEKLAHGVVEVLLRTGLARAGYIYVNLDDCWQLDRNATGHLVPDLQRFPHGIKHLADYVHRHGLKFGLYTNQGKVTCQRRPGAYRHELQDIHTYVEWGVDFIKNDNCFKHPSSDVYQNHKNFWDGIKMSGRDIIHSIKKTVPVEKAASVSHMRRVGDDITDEFEVMMTLVDIFIEEKLWKHSKPGFWNDLDVMEIGNGGMSQNEYVAHMALWCVLKSPLLLGNDLQKIDDFTLKLLTHREFIAINQDPLGESAELIYSDNAPNGTAKYRLMAERCVNAQGDSHSYHWLVQGDTLRNRQTGMCLGIDKETGAILVMICDDKSEEQKWTLDRPSGQIFSKSSPGHCLTVRWRIGPHAKLQPCKDRSNLTNQDTDEYWWNRFSDSYKFQKVPGQEKEYVMLTFYYNLYCFKVGAPHDLMIFGGRLSNNRHVALMLNRDVRPHWITLDFQTLPHFAPGAGQGPYKLRDIWEGQELGQYKESYTTLLPSHSTQTIVIYK